MTTIIEIKDLTLAYGTSTIIENFNATLAAGEFIGIFGPNGAGKSTLLRAILGLLPPYKGSIQILGSPAKRGHTAIGYVPQTQSAIHTNRLSGKTRIAASLNGFTWGLPFLTKIQQHEISEVLTLVNAKHYADRPYAELSGGERQRLLLAQALLNKPKILLLDEPLTNLDPRHQEALVALVHRIQQQLHVTVLFTAHDLNPLLHVMHRIIYLAHGRGVIGTVNEIVTNEKLSWLYGTPMEVIHHQQQLYVINQKSGGSTGDATHNHAPIGDV